MQDVLAHGTQTIQHNNIPSLHVRTQIGNTYTGEQDWRTYWQEWNELSPAYYTEHQQTQKHRGTEHTYYKEKQSIHNPIALFSSLGGILNILQQQKAL